MLWVLLVLMSSIDASRTVAWDDAKRQELFHDDASMSTRPLIYYCRSRNMEDFSCYWHPLENVSDTEDFTYVLTYTKDNGPIMECPDYLSSGPHSCHFDSSHTTIWKIYCMNVTAVTPLSNYSSPQHCLDVAEIVETEAPVNLTYDLYDAGGHEMGHNTVLSWTYPKPNDLQYGWITLVYELQYRRVNEPTNWKVKGSLREPHVELFGLPIGQYVVQVRCRSHNYGRWSQWSLPLYLSIPARPPTGKLLVLVLVTGASVVALIGFSLGLVHQSKRIKDYFLPPIPKPRIIGVDPLLLKKGNLEEINRHFSSFHGYSPPSYSYTDDVWDHVSADDKYHSTAPPSENIPNNYITKSTPKDPYEKEKDALIIPCNLSPTNLKSYVTNPTQCFCSISPKIQPDFVFAVPGSEYSVMEPPQITQNPDENKNKSNSTSDFYTCVQMMHDTGEVHLVPCLPPSYHSAFPNWDQKMKQKEEFEAKKIQDASEKGKKEEMQEVRFVSDAAQ
ncbi:growth hormone receptor-like [Eucyclogobius newberryi]|uniref:growth hormone receptor-like n=1 Tax=Eucyclogobius newberryi TaxID=166745 RepID=UPI003B5AAAB8